MPEVLIEIRNVNKEFRLARTVVYALKDITLDVYEGEYLSVMGPSGSGKSTLFNMIGALDKQTSGEVAVAGVHLTELTSRQLAHFRGNHIGYVFQAYNLLPAYDAVANVCMPLLFSGRSPEEAAERAREVLTLVGLGERLDHKPDELSGGQQQRVAIARALANEPAIVLADEPTANLDLKTGADIITMLKQLCAEIGVTVISATHDHKMLDICDRVVWIRDGAIERIELRENLDIHVGVFEEERTNEDDGAGT
jgi:putative ABC transport system ATP-binding protein